MLRDHSWQDPRGYRNSDLSQPNARQVPSLLCSHTSDSLELLQSEQIHSGGGRASPGPASRNGPVPLPPRQLGLCLCFLHFSSSAASCICFLRLSGVSVSVAAREMDPAARWEASKAALARLAVPAFTHAVAVGTSRRFCLQYVALWMRPGHFQAGTSRTCAHPWCVLTRFSRAESSGQPFVGKWVSSMH